MWPDILNCWIYIGGMNPGSNGQRVKRLFPSATPYASPPKSAPPRPLENPSSYQTIQKQLPQVSPFSTSCTLYSGLLRQLMRISIIATLGYINLAPPTQHTLRSPVFFTFLPEQFLNTNKKQKPPKDINPSEATYRYLAKPSTHNSPPES